MHDGLASELLREVKASAKRWFIIAIVCLGSCLVTNGMWIFCWFLPAETQTVTVDGKSGNANYINKGGHIENGKDCSEDRKKRPTISEKKAETSKASKTD